MFILLRAIYRFNTISIKIPMMYFSELQQIFQTCVWKHKKPPIATATLRKKNKVGGITRPNIKPHHKSTVIAAARYRHTADTQINGTALTPKGGNIHTCSMKSLGKEYSPPPFTYFFKHILSLWTHVHLCYVFGNNLMLHHLFYCSNFPSSDHWDLLQVHPCVPLIYFHPVVFFNSVAWRPPLASLSFFSCLWIFVPLTCWFLYPFPWAGLDWPFVEGWSQKTLHLSCVCPQDN